MSEGGREKERESWLKNPEFHCVNLIVNFDNVNLISWSNAALYIMVFFFLKTSSFFSVLKATCHFAGTFNQIGRKRYDTNNGGKSVWNCESTRKWRDEDK